MFAFVFAAQEWEPDMSEVTDQKDVVSSLFSVASDDRGAMIGTWRGMANGPIKRVPLR